MTDPLSRIVQQAKERRKGRTFSQHMTGEEYSLFEQLREEAAAVDEAVKLAKEYRDRERETEEALASHVEMFTDASNERDAALAEVERLRADWRAYANALSEHVQEQEKEIERLREELARREKIAVYKCDIRTCRKPAVWGYVGESGDLYFCAWHTVTYVQNAYERAQRYEKALREIRNELGGPGYGYPAPVNNAVKIARAALGDTVEAEEAP